MTGRTAIVWATCFVAIGTLALLVQLDVWRPLAGWMWPIVLMALGLSLLIAGAVGAVGASHGRKHDGLDHR